MNATMEIHKKSIAMNVFKECTFAVLMCLLLSSPVAAQKTTQEIVCIQCHSALPEKLSQPVMLWRGSIHAENSIACNNCHGGDPKDIANAMSPTRGFLGAPKEKDIPSFCGRCHVGVKKDYLASAHGRALGKGGPTCVTCHGNHSVAKASLELINEKSCSRCHSFERARVIKSAMQQTDSQVIAIEERIRILKQEGVDTDRFEKGLFSLRNRFHTLFHNVDIDKVNKESSQIITELKRLENELQGIDDVRHKRKIFGAIAVVAAFIAALLLHLLKKTYER